MLKDKLEALESTRASRRSVLKGLLVGLGATVLVQAPGGVFAEAPAQQDQPKAEKKKVEKGGDEPKKIDKAKTENKSDSKSKNEKKKTEEPKAQHKK